MSAAVIFLSRKALANLEFLSLDPFILPKVQVDTGAIKFVLQGANIMCPGMTSKGGRLEVDFATGAVVVSFLPPLVMAFLRALFLDCLSSFQVVMAEGKEQALAIGLTKMSRDEMYGAVSAARVPPC